MKQRYVCLLFSLIIMLAGCSAIPHKETDIREPEYDLTLESTVEQEDCFVCGSPPGGLLDYYYKFDSIGIIYWPVLTVIDTGVRTYDDNGNETLGGDSSGTRISSFGEGNGSIVYNPWPERGISEAKIYLGDADGLDCESLTEQLCQSCLDKVCGFYTGHVNSDDGAYLASTRYALIDFATGELYTLSNPYRGYSIRDYIVRYDFDEQGDNGKYIDLLVVYAPERM
ncbi:MAG TPA: hypothetical protein IAA07_12830 [Candidatus Lachnoclostridium stercoravium]|uniref:Lipoprotein n=1 Tax=Candidatus Lachnoclostridium stercoravium TaxID=2838633 RepID=A0A9D2HL41_9FIRM|nr:hypothetical protein [Candidatus Lachnoclostridium stercoravium]